MYFFRKKVVFKKNVSLTVLCILEKIVVKQKWDGILNPLTYNIESYSWYKLRSRFERKSKLQTYEISNQILNLISLNWTLINKSYVQCFDTLIHSKLIFYSPSKQCLFLKIEKKIVRQGVNYILWGNSNVGI